MVGKIKCTVLSSDPHSNQMVNTFWTDLDARKTFRVLDRKRLVKQVLEAVQLINVIGDIHWLAIHYQLPLLRWQDVSLIRRTYLEDEVYLVCDKMYGWSRSHLGYEGDSDSEEVKVQGRQLIPKVQQPNTHQRVSKCGYWNHPATKMWLFHLQALMHYFNLARSELVWRGTQHKYPPIRDLPTQIQWPRWCTDPNVINSHRSSLVNKEPQYYLSRFGSLVWNGYIWPEDHPEED